MLASFFFKSPFVLFSQEDNIRMRGASISEQLTQVKNSVLVKDVKKKVLECSKNFSDVLKFV